MAEWQCTLNWRDNNGRKAESRNFYSGGLSLAAVTVRAEALAAAAQAISSASLVSIELSKRLTVAGAPAPAEGSSVKVFLLLFYGNDTEAATLLVPSPRSLPVDMVGPYRAVRLVLDGSPVPSLLAALASSLGSVLTPRGTPWPSTILAGGFTEYRGPE